MFKKAIVLSVMVGLVTTSVYAQQEAKPQSTEYK